MTDADTTADYTREEIEDRIADWNGVVRKVWLDEPPEDAPVRDDPHVDGPVTEAEQRQLEATGQSAREVDGSEFPTVLRVCYDQSQIQPEVGDQYQVFAAVYDDGRKKDRIYYPEGETEEEAFETGADKDLVHQKLMRLRERDDVTLHHLGSVAEFDANADEYAFDWHSLSNVPRDLMEVYGPMELNRIKDRATADADGGEEVAA